jgi:hypothetical protein
MSAQQRTSIMPHLYKGNELDSSSVPNNEALVIGEFGIVNKPALCAFIACHLLSTYRSCRLQYIRFRSLFKRLFLREDGMVSGTISSSVYYLMLLDKV